MLKWAESIKYMEGKNNEYLKDGLYTAHGQLFRVAFNVPADMKALWAIFGLGSGSGTKFCFLCNCLHDHKAAYRPACDDCKEHNRGTACTHEPMCLRAFVVINPFLLICPSQYLPSSSLFICHIDGRRGTPSSGLPYVAKWKSRTTCRCTKLF